MSYSIVPAHLEDSDEVAYLHRLTRDVSTPYLRVLHSVDQDRRFLRDDVYNKCDVWIAKTDFSIVGFSAFRPGWIDHLYVHPNHQRHGIGSDLLTVAMKSHRSLQLWVFQRNEPAIAFYSSKGFKLVKTTNGARK